MKSFRTFDAVVIGTSAGGLNAMEAILPRLSKAIPVPILVVQHVSPNSESYMVRHFEKRCSLRVKEAEDKEVAAAGVVYFAPPNYHLLVELDGTLSLSTEERVNYSRPSIDVLFKAAAEAYGDGLIGIILTGANHDGAEGLARVAELGGLTIIQSPATAEAKEMPQAALDALSPNHVLSLEEIGNFLNVLLLGI